MKFSKSDRNEIFEQLVKGGIDPATCELEMDRDLLLTHPPSESLFHLMHDHGPDNRLRAQLIVGTDSNEFFYPDDWHEITGLILAWAKDARDYEQTPDLWAGVRRAKEALVSTRYETSENTPFTLAEQALISNHLREIKASVKENFELTAEQVSRIEDSLDEAEEASRRIGRKDWLLLFMGAVFTLIIAGTVTPDVAQHILTMALHGLGHLFAGETKPISGPHLK